MPVLDWVSQMDFPYAFVLPPVLRCHLNACGLNPPSDSESIPNEFIPSVWKTVLLSLLLLVGTLRAAVPDTVSSVTSYQYNDSAGGDTNTVAASPIVSYQYQDELHGDTNTTVGSAIVSYQYQDELDGNTDTTVGSPIVSYQFYEWSTNVVYYTESSASVSYFYQIGAGTTRIVLQGTVTDLLGTGIPGVIVMASVFQSIVAQTTTDMNGHYALPALESGVYVLQVSETAHASAARALTLSSSTAQQNFQLAMLSSAPPVSQTVRQPSDAYTKPPDGPMGSTLKVFDGIHFVPITAGNVPSANVMTIVLTHGWVQSLPDPEVLNEPFDLWPTDTAAKMLAQGITPGVANILAWDWRYAAEDPNVIPAYAVERIGEQGRALGLALTTLMGPNYSRNLHFIGHSLGSLVNAAAVNYLHGDRSGNARQPTSSTPWSNAQTHMTVLDQASIAEHLGATRLETGFSANLLDALNQSEAPPWESPLPIRFTWADNYKSLVSLPTLSGAVNARLQKSPSSLEAKHHYPIDWYDMSIGNPLNGANPLGFSQSYEYALSIGLPSSVFPPSTFAPGTLFSQSSDSDPLALALAFTPQQTTLILADNIVRGVNGTITAIGNVGAAVVRDAQASGQSIVHGFNNAVAMAQQGLQSVVNIYSSGVLSLSLSTGVGLFSQQVQNNAIDTMDVGASTNTAAMAWLPIEIPSDALAMVFDFTVLGDPMDDVIICGINDTNLFSLAASDVPTNTVLSSRFLNMSAWRGQQVQLFLGLMGGTSSNAVLQVDNIRFYSMQLPCLNVSRDGGSTALSWPSTVGGVMVEGATSLSSTNWEAITNAPVLMEDGYSVTNIWSDPVRFFRLRSQ